MLPSSYWTAQKPTDEKGEPVDAVSTYNSAQRGTFNSPTFRLPPPPPMHHSYTEGQSWGQSVYPSEPVSHPSVWMREIPREDIRGEEGGRQGVVAIRQAGRSARVGEGAVPVEDGVRGTTEAHLHDGHVEGGAVPKNDAERGGGAVDWSPSAFDGSRDFTSRHSFTLKPLPEFPNSSNSNLTSLDALLAAAELPSLQPLPSYPAHQQPSGYFDAFPYMHPAPWTTTYLPAPPTQSHASAFPPPFSHPLQPAPTDLSLWQDWQAHDVSSYYSTSPSSYSSSPPAPLHSPLTPNGSFDFHASFDPTWATAITEEVRVQEYQAGPAVPSSGLSQSPRSEPEEAPPPKRARTKRSGGGRISPPLDQEKRVYHCSHPGCNKAFARPSAVKTHMRTHSKEKPFVCHLSACRRAFTVFSNLKRHMKVHPDVDYSGMTSTDYTPHRLDDVLPEAGVPLKGG